MIARVAMALGEYISLKNVGEEEIELDEVSLGSGKLSFVLPTGLVLAPGEFVLVGNGAAEESGDFLAVNSLDATLWDETEVVWQTELGLSDKGGSLRLYDEEGLTVDELVFGAEGVNAVNTAESDSVAVCQRIDTSVPEKGSFEVALWGTRVATGTGAKVKQSLVAVRGLGEKVYELKDHLGNVRVGRWGSRDPLEGKYLNMSTYGLVGNMPVIAVDPDGRKIRIYYSTTAGKTKFVTISKKDIRRNGLLKACDLALVESGKNKFVKDVTESLIWIQESGDDLATNSVGDGVESQVASLISMRERLDIFDARSQWRRTPDGKKENNKSSWVGLNLFVPHCKGTKPFIIWNSQHYMKVETKINDDNTTVHRQSASVVFAHKVFHTGTFLQEWEC